MNCQQTCLSDFLPLNNRLQISVGLFYEIISLRFLVCSLTHAHSNSHPTIDLCTTINTSDPNILKVEYRKDTTLHETDPRSALCLPVSGFKRLASALCLLQVRCGFTPGQLLLFVLKCEADLSIFLSLISPPIVYSKINSSHVETFGHISVAI